jgi:hypothetical protein
MKPRHLQDITTLVSQRFPKLTEMFLEAGLSPDEVFVWHREESGHGEAILVINARGFEGEADGPLGEGSRLAVEAALRKYVDSVAIL